MKEFIIILILSFSFQENSFGQKHKAIEDSLTLEKFNSYVHSIILEKRDSIIPDSLPGKYQIRYKSSCSFTEYIWGTFGSNDVSYTTSGKTFGTNNNSDFLSRAPNTEQLYLCAEYPFDFKKEDVFSIKKDSTSKTENCITTNIILNNKSYKYPLGWWSSHHTVGVSYANGKYFIIEWSIITVIGNITSWGFTETIYLERVK